MLHVLHIVVGAICHMFYFLIPVHLWLPYMYYLFSRLIIFRLRKRELTDYESIKQSNDVACLINILCLSYFVEHGWKLYHFCLIFAKLLQNISYQILISLCTFVVKQNKCHMSNVSSYIFH